MKKPNLELLSFVAENPSSFKRMEQHCIFSDLGCLFIFGFFSFSVPQQLLFVVLLDCPAEPDPPQIHPASLNLF